MQRNYRPRPSPAFTASARPRAPYLGGRSLFVAGLGLVGFSAAQFIRRPRTRSAWPDVSSPQQTSRPRRFAGGTSDGRPTAWEGIRAGSPADKPRVAVVIPALNEASNLPHVLPALPPDLEEVILVDGLSTDGTVEVARRLRPDIRVVRDDRRGKGNALITGFAVVQADIIVTLDADGSADPEEITAFVDALVNGADLAKGTRFLDGGGSADLTIVRRLGNHGLNRLVNRLFRTRFTDLCYGYNAFWRDCLPFLDLDCAGFEIETLLHLRAVRLGLSVAEVPSFERRRVSGRSNLRPVRDGLRILGVVVRERRARAGSPPALPRRLGAPHEIQVTIGER